MFGLSWVRLAVYGAIAAAVIGGLLVVNGWRNDSIKLGVVQTQLDDANKTIVNDAHNWDQVGTRLDEIEKWQKDQSAQIKGNQTNVSNSLANFKNKTRHAATAAPGSPDDRAVRDGLLELIRRPAEGPPADRPAESRDETGLPATPH